ncbi:MAG: class I SAM-dependent methyltransferase [Candidatus Pacebacteria bacterium]|jgi:ubiquinone/menaquinone biosynthesis C-methylase UbiE|nr:class I SAM-dependent methyltransferase [Candidatus Paceibacterota bacterium]
MADKIVYRVEDGMNRKELKATTYQMRNFYHQFRDGFFTILDVMNYIQHYSIVMMMKPEWEVLDMCCGRSLLLPMIRYYAKDINSYTGIDIDSSNMVGDKINICNGKPINPQEHYPFKVKMVSGDVAKMPFQDNSFHFIVYTSSIEHMQKVDGEKSIHEAYRVLKPGGIMVLSCPNTPEDQNGYNTQYRAHIYEWKISELETEFKRAHFKVLNRIGLVSRKRDVDTLLDKSPFAQPFQTIKSFIPGIFYIPVLSAPFYQIAKEVLYVVKK